MKLTKIKKKPKLRKVSRLVLEPFSPNLTCEWVNFFPYKPVMMEYSIIETEAQIAWLHDEMMKQPAIAYDTETNTLKVCSDNKDFKCVGISISWGENNNYYIPVGHVREEDLDRQLTIDVVVKYLRPVFARLDLEVLGWNLKYDLHVFKRLGISVNTPTLFDGELASWLCNENTPNGLKENTLEKLHIKQEHFKEVTESVPNEVKKQYGLKANSKASFDLVLIDDGAVYACYDSFFTWCNCLGFKKLLEEEKMDKIYYKMYIPFLRVLFDMEEQGVTVDVDRLEEMGREMQEDLDNLQYKIYELSGVEFDIGSSFQKAEILFGYTKPSTEVKDIEKLPKFLQRAISEGDDVTLESRGYYRSGARIYKKANCHDNILDHSFNFTVSAVTKSGAPSTDNDAIWRLSHKQFKNKRKQMGVEMCKYLIDYAKIVKLKTAFVDGILEQLYDDGKAHPNFNQIGTDSGRISCSKPNLQQLPKADEEDKYQIRSVFIGSMNPKTKKRDKIIAIDYHNLEMVCLTHFSNDRNLSEMFANDDDAHGSTAVNMFNLDCTPVECKKQYPHLRQAAKTINFMLMYGGGASTLYDSLASDRSKPLDLGAPEYLEEYDCKDGVEVAQKFIDKYFESYSGVARFIREQKRFAHQHKYVYTILGRKRRLPDINSQDGKLRSYEERLSVNSAIQGTAGDITINAQIRVAKEERLKELECNMLIQVHDELVFECPEENVEEAIQIIKYDMEHPFGDDPKKAVKYLRADADFGDTYQEAK